MAATYAQNPLNPLKAPNIRVYSKLVRELASLAINLPDDTLKKRFELDKGDDHENLQEALNLIASASISKLAALYDKLFGTESVALPGKLVSSLPGEEPHTTFKNLDMGSRVEVLDPATFTWIDGTIEDPAYAADGTIGVTTEVGTLRINALHIWLK